VPFAVTFASTACWNAYGFAAPGEPSTPAAAAGLHSVFMFSCGQGWFLTRSMHRLQSCWQLPLHPGVGFAHRVSSSRVPDRSTHNSSSLGISS
jgi:hypothetical protein